MLFNPSVFHGVIFGQGWCVFSSDRFVSWSYPVEVLIVGGGPTGMFSAMELARYGVRNTSVFDSKPTTRAHPRGPAIHARLLELLSRHQGLVESLLEHGKLVS
ncbi:hypothetical protein BJ742DRAFT_213207 [Cladochytrium replicatum]|nr:hypothetical protein BJ742DRAFT_213207 [Cladochytrium replicatum]